MKILKYIILIPLFILFGPFVVIFGLGVFGFIFGDNGVGLTGLGKDTGKPEKPLSSYWWYKYVSFLFWKKGESIIITFLRLIFIQIPVFSIIITLAFIASLEWSMFVFKTLFNVDIKPLLDTLYSK